MLLPLKHFSGAHYPAPRPGPQPRLPAPLHLASHQAVLCILDVRVFSKPRRDGVSFLLLWLPIALTERANFLKLDLSVLQGTAPLTPRPRPTPPTPWGPADSGHPGFRQFLLALNTIRPRVWALPSFPPMSFLLAQSRPPLLLLHSTPSPAQASWRKYS